MQYLFSFFLSLLILANVTEAQASISKPFSSSQEATDYFNYHSYLAKKYYNKKKWREASAEFEKIIYFFPDTSVGKEAYYYLGVCFFEMKEYDLANMEFSNYLSSSDQPEMFEDTIVYKYWIAEYLKSGHKGRLFKFRYCPKIACGKELALTIYDEIVLTVPNHELAAASLYSKGCLLYSMGEYRDSVEAFQILIRRFPKHELTPASYLYINQAYCSLSKIEFQNPDILALAELNARKFKEEFPRDERVEVADGFVLRIKEMYAKGLCDLGLFYERIGQPNAAAIYFESSIEEFPTTKVASFCRKRLKMIKGEDYNFEEEADEPAASSENTDQSISSSETTPDLSEERTSDQPSAETNTEMSENSEKNEPETINSEEN